MNGTPSWLAGVQENVTLIAEINELRRELGQCRTRVHDLEASLGVHRSDAAAAAVAARASVGDAAAPCTSAAALLLQLEEKAKVVELQVSEPQLLEQRRRRGPPLL